MKRPTPVSTDTDGQVITWKTPYNHDTEAEVQRTSPPSGGESMTQQHFRDEQDINKIVERVLRGGDMPPIPVLQYTDLTTLEDFHTMHNKLAEAKDLFYRLKPQTRAELLNDPGAWIEFVNQAIADGNLEPLREMGLDMASVDAQIERIKKEADDAAYEARRAAEKPSEPKDGGSKKSPATGA